MNRPRPELSGESDAIAKARSGDETGWDWLIHTWQGPLTAFLMRHTGNEEDALEVAQEAFIRAIRNITRFRDGSRFSTWLFGIALNLVRDLKKSARSRLVESLPEMDDVEGRSEIAKNLEERELTRDLRRAIDRLPEGMRNVLMLFYEEELSMNEISVALKVPVSLIKVRLFRARKQLAKANPQLKEYLWT